MLESNLSYKTCFVYYLFKYQLFLASLACKQAQFGLLFKEDKFSFSLKYVEIIFIRKIFLSFSRITYQIVILFPSAEDKEECFLLPLK